MITVDLKSRIPIYEQIVDSVKNAILSGILSPNEQLPAVRKLAVELAINPNTIQKAYLILEAQEIVYSIPGKGSFVADDTSTLVDSHRAKVLSDLKSLIEDATRCGISQSELVSVIKEFAKE